MATAKQLYDIKACPICTEEYKEPRVLPCGHTFCLTCIRECSKHKHPGDESACPLCRKEFTLPSNGVDDLPKNFFVTNFLEMNQLTSVESKTESKTSGCEACGGSGETTEMRVATAYCVECQQKLCQACEEDHKKFKVTSRHKIVELGSELSLKLPLSDVDKITAGVDQCREMLAKIEKDKNDFNDQIAKTETEISEKIQQLKRMIDVHKANLMKELSSMKQKRMKEIESLRQNIQRQMLSIKSYGKYVDKVRQKGTACDTARSANDLHDKADELLKFDDIERTLDDLGHTGVMFTSSDVVLVDDVNKTLGQLRLGAVHAC